MNPLLAVLVGFFVSAVAVVVAGVWLAKTSDVIAARSRLGRLWVGSIFLAFATSLPELTTDIAAVRIGAPNLAAGDLFGSSMANMLVLALVALVPGAELFRRAAVDHGLAASLAVVLTCIAGIFILLDLPWSVLGIGPGPALLAIAYLAGTRTIFRQSALMKRLGTAPEIAAGTAAEKETARLPSLRRAVIGFVLATLVTVVAAPVFATSAARIAVLTGIGTTFIGTWLVGFATSLPELVAATAAVRIAAYDLAVGSLFGSNAVNMILFLPLDVANGPRPILSVVSPVHALTALIGVVLMAIALASILYRSEHRRRLLDPTSLLIVLLYIFGLIAVYLRSA